MDGEMQTQRLKKQNPDIGMVGFSLLEVVVALAIVGLGVVTLMEIFSLGLRLANRSATSIEIVTSARQAMDAYLIRGEAKQGRKDRPIGQGLQRYTIVTAPVRDETELNLSNVWELTEVTLDGRYRAGDRESRVGLKTLRVVKRKER